MSAPDTPPGIFSEPPEDKSFPATAVSIAAVAVAILVTVLVLVARRPAPPAPTAASAAYAPNIELSGIQMSEADSRTGGRLIYIDGRVTNHGSATVTGVRVQVTFPDDLSQPPQVETVPMNVIYMRDPYVDTRPISAAPLAPGGSADFRLIFDDINENWNQQPPDFHIVQVAIR